MAYISDFGVERVFGTGEGTEFNNRSDATVHNFGAINQMVVNFDLPRDETLPQENAGAGFAKGIAGIPANSVVLDATLVVYSLDGAISCGIGLYKKDGTVVNATGLKADSNLAVGKTELTGAMIGTNIGEDKLFIKFSNPVIAEGATISGKLIVNYA